MTYYYGIYSSSHRGKEERENCDNQSIETKEVSGIGKASSTWARLIRKIFEVEALRCQKCGGEMRIIAFITNHDETKKILKHIGEETVRSPPLKPIIITENIHDTQYRDFIPPVDAYIRDPEYAN